MTHLIRPFAGLRPAPGSCQRRRRPALRCAFHRRGTRARHGKAMELPAYFQAGNRPAAGNRPLCRRGLRQGSGKSAENAGCRRACPRRSALLLRLSPGHGRPQPDRAGRGGLGGGLRHQPHPQARVHPPRQGRRPGAPDRCAQCPDRPGVAGLPRCPASGRDSRPGQQRPAGCRCHGGRRHPPHHLGDPRCRHASRS